MYLFKKSSPFTNLGFLFTLTNLLLRLVLFCQPITQSKFSVIDMGKMIFLGLLSDIFVFLIASAFLWLYTLTLSNAKFNQPWGYLILSALLLLLGLTIFGNTILDEYGGPLPSIGIAFLSIKTAFFALLLFLPKYRHKIRLALYSITLFIMVFIILLNATSELVFWNEFGLRYNFIAVDYLIYTHAVLRNIIESYPVGPILIGIGFLSAGATYLMVQRTLPFLANLPSFTTKIKNLFRYCTLFFLALLAIPALAKLENSDNVFNNEIQANGFYKFYYAFRNSKLEFNTFYKTLPIKESFKWVNKQLPGCTQTTVLRSVKADQPEIHKNVVLITLESFSADFLKAYGNTENLTPFLDTLATQSMQFTNLYAVGNRTVRGLEAVTLCLPPSPAESVVKQKDNKNKFSTGSLFKQKGYQIKYLYGGDSFFDNMGDFFSGNSYDLVDKKAFAPNEISFSNIWGVCDEDLFRKAIKVMNKEAQSNKPFFNHIMTVSNHRPFTYPDGKIDIPNNAKSRSGGVKYTDFALSQFFKAAQNQPWFKNTVFVVLADHCASSAGKTELPMDKYRIPALIYAPGFIQPCQVNTLMSQIDIMPTLFGQLHFQYQSKFYGQDIFQANYKPRAFIATYQDLGLIKDNFLTIISPVKKVKQFKLIPIINPKLKPNFQIAFKEIPTKINKESLVKQTIAFYHTTAYLLKNKKYQKTVAAPKN